MKLFLLALAVALSNPQSIHWSSQGDYLVDENGQRVTISGHPRMVCYEKGRVVAHGWFLRAKGATIWIRLPKGSMFQSDTIIRLDKPVCDLKS